MAQGCNVERSCIGPFCIQASITEASIINRSLPKLNGGPKNGVVVELNEYRKRHGISWADFYDWMYQMYDDDAQVCALPMFKVYVGRLEKKMLTLKRNKQHEKMQVLMDELFTQKKKELTVQNPLAGTLTKNTYNTANLFDLEVLKDVNKKLAVELHAAESALEAQKEETEKLCEKLSHLNVRNVNKRIKRRDDKIEKCKS